MTPDYVTVLHINDRTIRLIPVYHTLGGSRQQLLLSILPNRVYSHVHTSGGLGI